MPRPLAALLLLLVIQGCGESEPPAPSPETLQATLTASAEAGDPQAQYALAVAQARGEFGEPDPDAYEYWLRRAAENQHPRAQEQLGQLLLAWNTPTANREALDWFQRAAAQGNPRAYYSLGVMHASGRGVPTNLPEAYLWLSLAAESGHQAAVEAREAVGGALSEAQRDAAEKRIQSLLK